jgi:hypothetical protein
VCVCGGGGLWCLQRGECRFGDLCRLSHDLGASPRCPLCPHLEPFPGEDAFTAHRRQAHLCPYYAVGLCTFGKRCRLFHDESPLGHP